MKKNEQPKEEKSKDYYINLARIENERIRQEINRNRAKTSRALSAYESAAKVAGTKIYLKRAICKELNVPYFVPERKEPFSTTISSKTLRNAWSKHYGETDGVPNVDKEFFPVIEYEADVCLCYSRFGWYKVVLLLINPEQFIRRKDRKK